MADIDDFDIDRSTAQAWAEFEARLGEVISVIDDSADLTIGIESVADRAPYVRFSSPARDRVCGEAAGNAELADSYRLSPEQVAAMTGLGWQPPAGGGTGSRFSVEDSQDNSERLSALAVGALRDVYGVQHPVFLAPDQLAEVLTSRSPTVLATPEFDDGDVVATLPASQPHLDRMVDEELTEMFGHRPIRDSEGDVAIRVGSTMVFLRTTPDAREILLFAAVVHDVDGRSRAMEVLNDLNVAARWVKFQLVRDRVFVMASVLARPFVPAHLQQAVRFVSDTADGIDDQLAAKLNGRTTFGDGG